ncbi:beta/alpha barrel domain-containing protein [Aestuariimicrobium ganziense]|uniref:aldolase n=1 Tax=Aestuariimicrobium ganziense TaxID=2773677 RepID=UPI0019414EDE|nr:aldolase [Aestuariimicrobium ganziense]
MTAEPTSPPALPEVLTRSRLFAVLPPLNEVGDAERLLVVLEVMAQEGIEVISLPFGSRSRLNELREMFSHRLWFGMHGVGTRAALDDALAMEPEFVLLEVDDPELVQVGLESGVCVLPAALTPNEVRRAASRGAAAVQVVPGDLLGGTYPASLAAMVPGVALVPRGGLGGWSAGRWYEAGAVACGLDDGLFSDVFPDGNLAHLRERCRTFLKAAEPKA